MATFRIFNARIILFEASYSICSPRMYWSSFSNCTLREVRLDKNQCRDRGLCLPCPQKLDVAAMLRFHRLFNIYGLADWTEKLYEGLAVGVENCTKCGECEPKYLCGLPIISMLQNAPNRPTAIGHATAKLQTRKRLLNS
jgi:CO dehydrogenase/acetyl-CoA synthase alpha subunit